MEKNVTLFIEEKQAFPQAKMLKKPTFFFFFVFLFVKQPHCYYFVVNMSYSRVKVFYFGLLYNWPSLYERSPHTFLNFGSSSLNDSDFA